MSALEKSFAAGYAYLSAWTDLLDQINVFPVTDGDTGTNLRISLAPLRNSDENVRNTRTLLAHCATGNSGNIAAAFFLEFCQAESSYDLAETAAAGRKMAWQAIASPCAGTMLTVFDQLASTLASVTEPENLYSSLNPDLQKAVHTTSQILPELREAGVVDSGALAMYLYFDGFFRNLTGQKDDPVSIIDIFAGKLAVSSSFQPENTNCYCVDVTLQVEDKETTTRNSIAELGESAVILQDKSTMKVHLHTPDPHRLRNQLDSFGDVSDWSHEKINQQAGKQQVEAGKEAVLHIVTDAAGSITRKMARDHGITLLDSHIIAGDNSRPESLYSPDQIYPLMRKGIKITTAQSSTLERHQHYQSICRQFGRSLYLCVGSAFTGNYAAAVAWKKEYDFQDFFSVLDTGAASGRLALIALLTARHSKFANSSEEVIEFARKSITECKEYVFIDQLKYLAAGGRITRTKGFFGSLLNIKPVISPTGNEVRKSAVVHSRNGQLEFALKKINNSFQRSTASPLIMLQYTDNEEWVGDAVQSQIRTLLPKAEILLTPLSLTSGVHMGPGTWSIAFTHLHLT